MLRDRRRRGLRFLAGLIVGGAAGGIALAIPAYLIGTALHAVVPPTLRTWVLVLVCVGFGVADLLNRTPHVWRQVPQQLVQRFPPGALGLTWGFDLGLLFTTQKATSLIWISVAAVTLLQPGLVGLVLVGIAVLASLAVLVGSTSERTARWLVMKRKPRLVQHLRQVTGVSMVLLAVLTAVSVWVG
jgi:hypothetical protein